VLINVKILAAVASQPLGFLDFALQNQESSLEFSEFSTRPKWIKIPLDSEGNFRYNITKIFLLC